MRKRRRATFPPPRVERKPVEVEGPDRVVRKGEYWTDRGDLFVESVDRKTSQAVRIGRTDELCLAKTVLLELYGQPLVAWPAHWKPAGCEGKI